jgi:hypothetical protein
MGHERGVAAIDELGRYDGFEVVSGERVAQNPALLEARWIAQDVRCRRRVPEKAGFSDERSA